MTAQNQAIESDKINLEAAKINQPVSEKNGSGSIKVMFSLFDVPERVYSVADKGAQQFGLRFEYLGGNEQTFVQSVNDGIDLELGKKSGRLYGIFMPLELMERAERSGKNYEIVFDLAEKGVEYYRKANPKTRSRSFEAVTRVLETYAAQLAPIMRQAMHAA